MEDKELIQKFKVKFDKNFMTPDVIGYQVKKNRVVEISEGRGFENEKIYGITVRDYKNREWKDPELSKMFHSRRQADIHAKKALEKVI